MKKDGPKAVFSIRRSRFGLCQSEVDRRLTAITTGFDVERHGLAVVQLADASTLNCRDVHEHIFAAVLNHFTVPLAIVDTPVNFATRSMRWPGLVSTRSSVWSRKKRQQVDIADIARPPCALFVRKASLSERHAPEAADNRN